MLSTIPRIGLGTWAIDSNIANLVYEALKSGYRHVDCAEIYQNQKEVGEGLTKALNEKIVSREELWITSKVWNCHHKDSDVKKSCMQTLKDLNLKYLDLLLIHWPISKSKTGDQLMRVPLSETWAALENLVTEGLVKHIGVSNFDIQLLNDLLSYCKIKPYTNQVECHPYLQQTNLLEFCANENIHLTCYSPLARYGALKNKSFHPATDKVLDDIAKKHKKSIAQVMLKWALQRDPNIVVIPKTGNTSRLNENQALDFKLDDKDMEQISSLDCNGRIIITPGPIKVFV